MLPAGSGRFSVSRSSWIAQGRSVARPPEDETSLVLLAGAGVGMPEAVDLPYQEALRLRNNRSLAEQLLGSQQTLRCRDAPTSLDGKLRPTAGHRWAPTHCLLGMPDGVLFADWIEQWGISKSTGQGSLAE